MEIWQHLKRDLVKNIVEHLNKSLLHHFWGSDWERPSQMLISHEEVIWLHFERNTSPILRQLILSFKCQFPLRMKYESTPKQILPPFWGSEWKPLHLWGRFRHFVMKLSEPKVLQVNFSVRGRAKPSRNLSCSQFSLRWGPSKILLPLSGGCGSRLSICQAQANASKKQNKYWDDTIFTLKYTKVINVAKFD